MGFLEILGLTLRKKKEVPVAPELAPKELVIPPDEITYEPQIWQKFYICNKCDWEIPCMPYQRSTYIPPSYIPPSSGHTASVTLMQTYDDPLVRLKEECICPKCGNSFDHFFEPVIGRRIDKLTKHYFIHSTYKGFDPITDTRYYKDEITSSTSRIWEDKFELLDKAAQK